MAARGTCGQIASFFFFLLSYVAFVAAFSSNYWMDETGKNWGLWKVCTNSRCTNTVGNDIMTVSFVITQVLMTVTVIGGTVSLGSYIAWLATQDPRPCVVAWATNVTSGFCKALGLICWGNESVRYYGLNVLAWSFWLALASCVLTVLNSSLTACVTGCGADLEEDSKQFYLSSKSAPTYEMQTFQSGPRGDARHGRGDYHVTSNDEYDSDSSTGM